MCGTVNETCSSGGWRETYADYLVQYIKYYEQEGIIIDIVGFLNTPKYRLVVFPFSQLSIFNYQSNLFYS